MDLGSWYIWDYQRHVIFLLIGKKLKKKIRKIEYLRNSSIWRQKFFCKPTRLSIKESIQIRIIRWVLEIFKICWLSLRHLVLAIGGYSHNFVFEFHEIFNTKYRYRLIFMTYISYMYIVVDRILEQKLNCRPYYLRSCTKFLKNHKCNIYCRKWLLS